MHQGLRQKLARSSFAESCSIVRRPGGWHHPRYLLPCQFSCNLVEDLVAWIGMSVCDGAPYLAGMGVHLCNVTQLGVDGDLFACTWLGDPFGKGESGTGPAEHRQIPGAEQGVEM